MPLDLVPVDHDPFSADDMVGQANAQLATQPDRMAGISVHPVDPRWEQFAKPDLIGDRRNEEPIDLHAWPRKELMLPNLFELGGGTMSAFNADKDFIPQPAMPTALSIDAGLGSLNDVGAPAVPDGGQVSPGTYWGNRAADIASRFGMQAMTGMATLPQRLIENSQESLNTGNYDPSVPVEAALTTMGTGGIAGVPVRAGEQVLGAGAARRTRFEPVDHDPFTEEAGKTYWSDLAKTKHPVAVEDMTATQMPTGELGPRPVVSPEDLAGSILTPAVGDRTAAGATLTHVNGNPLSTPVDLQGGPDFMRGPSNAADNAVWASDKGVITRLAKHTRNLAEENPGRDVNFVYSAMGARSGDYSHMMSDALLGQLENAPVTRKATAAFDASMRDQNPKWPGLKNLPKLREALANDGGMRKQFVEEMALKGHQDQRFPEIGSTRHAISTPALIGQPTGVSGYAISRLDPAGRVIANPTAPHTTYNTQLGGKYLGGLDTPIPREVMFPDFFASRRAQNLPKLADDRAFSMSNVAQAANQRWLDGVMKHIEQQKQNGGFTLGSGATDKRGAALAVAGNQNGGIRAYHGSPHDFDAFDMSKIGTGEGAQAYGHGLYFAENEGTAKSYRDALTRNSGKTNLLTSYRDGILDDSPRTFERFLAARFRENKGDLPSTISQLESDLKANPKDGTIVQALDLAKHPDTKLNLIDHNPGKMYEVNINADPAHMLEHDVDLNKQHPNVQAAVKGLQAERLRQDPNSSFATSGDIETGGTLAARLEHEVGPDKATKMLSDAGIPGIKYLDQGSRITGDAARIIENYGSREKALEVAQRRLKTASTGDLRYWDNIVKQLQTPESRNYVVFNDQIIDILRKYGLAGISMLPPAIAAEVRKQIQPVDHDPFAGGS